MNRRMSIAVRGPMTLTEFLDLEERQDLRREFDAFEFVAVTGGTLARETIGDKIRFAL